MADKNRTTVNRLVLHHAVTPLWQEKSKAQLAQWFSDNGFARAYSSNPNNWSGLINPYTGGRSYSQAHFAGQYVTAATPDATQAERDAGFRLVPLVNDVWGQITWHAGNWAVNQSSIGIENLGDFRNYTLSDQAQKVIAAFWRPRDLELSGNSIVSLHQEIYETACPARIAEVRQNIVNYINNPPQPPKPQTPTWSPMDNPRSMRVKAGGSNLVDIVTGAVVKGFSAGEQIDNLVQKSDWNGQAWVRTKSSADRNVNTGFNFNTLEELPVITTKDITETTPIPFTSKNVEDNTLPTGVTKVVQVGVNGVRTIVYTVTYTNGVETGRVTKSNTITKQPIEQITAVGTYVEPDVPVAPEPGDGENAASWLQKVWEWVKEVLKSFTYKK